MTAVEIEVKFRVADGIARITLARPERGNPFDDIFAGELREVAETRSTDDIRHAISQTRRTLTPELVADFEQDITENARI